MKIYLKFDHSQDDTLEAIGYEGNGDQVNDQIKNVIHKWNDDDDVTMSSQFAEIIHNELDYEVILFLALKAMENKILELKMEELKENFKNFLDEHL